MATMSDPGGFLDSTPLVPIELECDGFRVTWVGRQAVDLTGHEAARWLDEEFWSSVVLPDDQITIRHARRNSAEAEGRHEVDYRMETADGRVVWVVEMLRHVDTERGPRLRGFLWNISDRKRQELALWKAEERLRGLLRRAPDAMVMTDAGGTVVNMNDRAEALFGYSLSEIVGSRLEHLFPEPLRPALAELRAAFGRDPARKSLVAGEVFSVECGDRSEVPVEIALSRVSAEDDETTLMWAVRDLTVRRRADARRARASTDSPGS